MDDAPQSGDSFLKTACRLSHRRLSTKKIFSTSEETRHYYEHAARLSRTNILHGGNRDWKKAPTRTSWSGGWRAAFITGAVGPTAAINTCSLRPSALCTSSPFHRSGSPTPGNTLKSKLTIVWYYLESTHARTHTLSILFPGLLFQSAITKI